MTKKLLLLLAPFLILVFQNCGSMNSDSSDFNSKVVAGANGDSYEGKLTLNAPSHFVPGTPITIEVLGGQPPYEVTTNSSAAEVVAISANQFVIQPMADEAESIIQLQVTDSLGEAVSADIAAIGINRWFFDKPELVTGIDSSRMAFVQKSGRELILLSLEGEILSQTTLFLESQSGRVSAIDYDSRLKRLLLIDSENQQLQIRDALGGATKSPVSLPINCEEYLSLAQISASQVAILCAGETDFSIIDLESQSSQTVELERPIGELQSLQKTREGLFLAGDTGRFQEIALDGRLLRSGQVDLNDFELKKKAEGHNMSLESLQLGEALLTSTDEILIQSHKGKHIRRHNWQGKFLSSSAGQGIYVGQVARLDAMDLLGEDRFVLLDSNFNRLNIYDLQGKFVNSFGANGFYEGAFNSPTSLVFDGENNLFVHDSKNGRVQKFNEDLRLTASFHHLKSQFHQIGRLSQLTLMRDGSLISSNSHRKRVQIYNPGLDQGETLLVPDHIPYQSPVASLELSDGRILVLDQTNGWVYVFDKDRQYLQKFGEYGHEEHQMRQPIDIEYSAQKKEIYIYAKGNSAIFVFDENFNFVRQIKGKGRAGVKRAVDLAIGPQGYFYLVDERKNRIVVMDSSGNFVSEIGPNLPEHKRLNQPTGIAVSSKGLIAVSEKGAHRVQFFPKVD